MKWVVNIAGILLTLIGLGWFLQGINVIPVGGMAGQTQWVIIGAVVMAAGVALLFFFNRRRGPAAQPPK